MSRMFTILVVCLIHASCTNARNLLRSGVKDIAGDEGNLVPEAIFLITISGTVKTSSNIPIPGAAIGLYNPNGGGDGLSTVADENGVYTFSNISPGTMRIWIGQSYGNSVRMLPIGWNLGTSVTVLQSTSSLDITVPPTVTFDINVLDSTGAPFVSQAEVIPNDDKINIQLCPTSPIIVEGTKECFVLFVGGDLQGGQGTQTYTDSNGKARLVMFQTDQTVVIRAFPIGSTARNGFATLDLRSSAVVDITIPGVVTISGQLVSSTGVPCPGIIVVCQSLWTTSDSNGHFSYSNMLAGSTTIRAGNPTGYQLTVPGCIPFDTGVTLSVDASKDVDVILTLFPMVTISIQVLNATGYPSSYARVQSCSDAPVTVVNTLLQETAYQGGGCQTPSGDGKADKYGIFSMSYLQSPTATVQIMVTDPVYSGISVRSNPFSVAEDSTVVITLPAPIIVAGHLVTSAGEPVRYVYISCMGSTKFTDQSGYFSFTVPPGSVRITISQQWTCVASNNGLIPCGWLVGFNLPQETSTNSLVVTLPPIVTYQVFVVDDRDGTPIVGATLYPTNSIGNGYYLDYSAEFVPGSERVSTRIAPCIYLLCLPVYLSVCTSVCLLGTMFIRIEVL